MEVLWWPDADRALTRLERSGPRAVLEAVRRTLGELEVDPFKPGLGTRQFQTPDFGHVRATPVRATDWWVLWQLGEADGTIEVILVREIAL